MTQFQRGALRSPSHKAFAAPRHVASVIPASFGIVPGALQMWGNGTYGDCVSAEEAASKAAFSVFRGAPELLIPDATLVAWARQHGYLNGANLTDVMDTMISTGITVNGVTYKDGPYQSVDWTDDAVLSSAIYQGPVKIAVAANQVENSGAGQRNGWIGSGWRRDQNTDHCVALWGFGTARELAGLLGTTLDGRIDPSARSYLMYTWSTIGIVERQSMINVTDEAWLRGPTTVPDPVPAPTPPPNPSPTPNGSGVVVIDLGSRTISGPSGWTVIPSP